MDLKIDDRDAKSLAGILRRVVMNDENRGTIAPVRVIDNRDDRTAALLFLRQLDDKIAALGSFETVKPRLPDYSGLNPVEP